MTTHTSTSPINGGAFTYNVVGTAERTRVRVAWKAVGAGAFEEITPGDRIEDVLINFAPHGLTGTVADALSAEYYGAGGTVLATAAAPARPKPAPKKR